MDYQRIYNKLIYKVRQENRSKGQGIYYEKHHIIPKCIGGSNEKHNLILLAAREHFIAHKILCRIYPHESKLKFALWKMICQENEFQQRYSLSSREYENIRKEVSKAIGLASKERWQNPIYAKRVLESRVRSNIQNPQRIIDASVRNIERYKDPKEREKTGLAIKQALTNNPKSIIRRALFTKNLFKTNPELIKNSRHPGQLNGRWEGYCYVYNRKGKLSNTFETKEEARKILKCRQIVDDLVLKKGKYKGYKFVISKDKK